MRKIIAITALLFAVFAPVPRAAHAVTYTCTHFLANAYQAYGRCNNGADDYRVMARNARGSLCYGNRASNGAWSIADCWDSRIVSVWVELPPQ
jgi:hypothetical protein